VRDVGYDVYIETDVSGQQLTSLVENLKKKIGGVQAQVAVKRETMTSSVDKMKQSMSLDKGNTKCRRSLYGDGINLSSDAINLNSDVINLSSDVIHLE